MARMNEADFTKIERDLLNALSSEHGVVADVAYRGLIRVLAEVRALRQENAAMRTANQGQHVQAF